MLCVCVNIWHFIYYWANEWMLMLDHKNQNIPKNSVRQIYEASKTDKCCHKSSVDSDPVTRLCDASFSHIILRNIFRIRRHFDYYVIKLIITNKCMWLYGETVDLCAIKKKLRTNKNCRKSCADPESIEKLFVLIFRVFFFLLFVMKMFLYAVYAILWIPLVQLDAAITLAGKQCGTKICHIMEFCSTFNNQCENCDNVCNTTAHNYDQVICTTQCQGNMPNIETLTGFHWIKYMIPICFRLNFI